MFRTYYLLPLLIPLLFVKGNFAGRIFAPIERWLRWLVWEPWRAVSLVGAVSLGVCALLTGVAGVPAAQTHDEFGYLLLGDTFAHGRVTNPTPPLWQHFETIHEIMVPTYTAKYPPGQGLALAAGELMGKPIIGVWIATAFACAAICWMLLAWTPPRWALAGGLLAALHPQVLEWSQNYWGGAVAMGGGALVLGAFRRLVKEPRARDAAWMGVGLGVMANSRPYEGFVMGGMVLLMLTGWLIWSRRFPVSVIFRKMFLPLTGVLAVFAVQIGYYDWRVTGNPVVMPYMVHEQQYAMAPQFLYQKPHPEPDYRHSQIRRLHENYLAYYQSQVASKGALMRAIGSKIWILAQGYLWSFLMLVPLLALPVALQRDKWLSFATLAGILLLAAVMVGTWVFPHYVAPGVGLFFVLLVQSMRCLHAWHIGTRRVGRNVVRGLAVLIVISFFQLAGKMAHIDKTMWYYQREGLLKKLEAAPGKSLLIVNYAPDHNPHREWVYNEGDIPAAKVILARDMGTENRALMECFPDRKVWLVHADAARPELEPFPGS